MEVRHPLDGGCLENQSEGMSLLWGRCIRTCRRGRRVIRIEIGDGAGIRENGLMPGREGAGTSATHDNGTESARHARLRDKPGTATCFADELPELQDRRGRCTSK